MQTDTHGELLSEDELDALEQLTYLAALDAAPPLIDHQADGPAAPAIAPRRGSPPG